MTIKIIISFVLSYVCCYIFSRYIQPAFMTANLKIIETNPKWLVSKLNERYYGFHDIDILLADNPYLSFPVERFNKKTNHIEIILSNDDTTTKDIDDIAQLALSIKLIVKYQIFYEGKSADWLSILCYMIEGNDINIDKVKWEEKEDNKPIDC